MVKLDTFEGHLVLLCKGWYIKNNDFFDSLKRLWAVRCGVPEFEHDRVFENIADSMFEIMHKCSPGRMEYFHQVLHRELTSGYFKPEGMSTIKAIIWEYRSFLMQLQIRHDEKGVLVSLPKPQKQIIERICNGNGRYEDYNKLTTKDKRK